MQNSFLYSSDFWHFSKRRRTSSDFTVIVVAGGENNRWLFSRKCTQMIMAFRILYDEGFSTNKQIRDVFIQTRILLFIEKLLVDNNENRERERVANYPD